MRYHAHADQHYCPGVPLFLRRMSANVRCWSQGCRNLMSGARSVGRMGLLAVGLGTGAAVDATPGSLGRHDRRPIQLDCGIRPAVGRDNFTCRSGHLGRRIPAARSRHRCQCHLGHVGPRHRHRRRQPSQRRRRHWLSRALDARPVRHRRCQRNRQRRNNRASNFDSAFAEGLHSLAGVGYETVLSNGDWASAIGP